MQCNFAIWSSGPQVDQEIAQMREKVATFIADGPESNFPALLTHILDAAEKLDDDLLRFAAVAGAQNVTCDFFAKLRAVAEFLGYSEEDEVKVEALTGVG